MTVGETLAGRVALVSGAAGGGLGTASALALGQAGASVYVNARDVAQAEEAAAKLAWIGVRAAPLAGDVADPDAVDRMRLETAAAFGAPDILVHNAAGGEPFAPAWELAPTAWQREFGPIVQGAFNLVRAFVPAMLAKRYGRIVLVSSSAAVRGTRGRGAAYAAAKAALSGLCVQLALELAPHGVVVNAIAPGQLDTPRVRRGGRKTDATMSRLGASLPIGRVGTAEEVARLVRFLASDACPYLLGQTLCVDGGAGLARLATAAAGAEPAHAVHS